MTRADDDARSTEREMHGGGGREAQDRNRNPETTQGQAESPVDSMHADAPTQQENARGHKRIPQREEGRGSSRET